MTNTVDEAIKTLDATTVAVGQVYQHFKTRRMYTIVDLGINTETLVPTVGYRVSGEDSYTWYRPLEMFLSTVDGVPRFTRLGD